MKEAAGETGQTPSHRLGAESRSMKTRMEQHATERKSTVGHGRSYGGYKAKVGKE